MLNPTAPRPHSAAQYSLRLNYIDGLRALAAIWVVLSHWWLFRIHSLPGIAGLLTNWLEYSHLAVDGFIVISGFCLIIPTARSLKTKDGTLGFYKRRARRILPPLYAALILAYFFALLVNHFGKHLSEHQDLGMKTFLANVFLLQDYVSSRNVVNAPLWSVAAEWKIYFLFPLLLLIMRRSNLWAMLGISASLAVAHTFVVSQFEPNASLEHAGTWYIFLFGLGVAAGYIALGHGDESHFNTWMLPCFLVSSALLVLLFVIYPLGDSSSTDAFDSHTAIIDPTMGTVFAAFLGLLAQGKAGRIKAFLEHRWLVFIGTYSYSIYLTHLFVLDVCRVVVDKVHVLSSHPAAQLAIIGATGLPLVFIFAYLFFLIAEKPFLTQRRNETQVELAQDAVLSPAP